MSNSKKLAGKDLYDFFKFLFRPLFYKINISGVSFRSRFFQNITIKILIIVSVKTIVFN